jgi:hypothetical protein
MAPLEILHHGLELAAHFSVPKAEDRVNQPLRPRRMRSIALPGKVKWTNDDA